MIEFSLALFEVFSRRASKGLTPPASTIETRLPTESLARFARAAAAGSLPLSWSMLTSCLMINTRFEFSIDRRTRPPSACSRVREFSEPSRLTRGPMPSLSVMALRLLAFAASS